MDRYPNFFCVGAQKAGTSTLYAILAQHPEIFLTSPKETHYFFDDVQYAKGFDKYRKYYSDWQEEKIAGEIDPVYLPFEKVPMRIFHTLGVDVQILVVLRNPLERAYSQYWMNRRKGYEKLPFVKALEAESTRIAAGDLSVARFGYAYQGHYARHLYRYFEIFGKHRIMVMFFESDLIGKRGETVSSILKFLDVASIELDTEKKSNPSKMPIFPGVSSVLHKDNWLRNLARASIPSRTLRSALRGSLERPYSPQPLTPNERMMLYDRYFSGMNEELEALLSVRLPTWK